LDLQLSRDPLKHPVENGLQDCQLLKYYIQHLALKITSQGFQAYVGEGGDVKIAELAQISWKCYLPELDKARRGEKDQTLEDPTFSGGCHFHNRRDT
jgi:hypothetical protein